MKNPFIYCNSLAPAWDTNPETEKTAEPEKTIQIFSEGPFWPEMSQADHEDFQAVG